MTPKSFSVRIYCQDGHADGVKLIAKSKWSGRALVIPRASLPGESNRAELNAPGVYVLVGPSVGGDLPSVYVGAVDPVCRDLEQHSCRKDLWEWCIVFASKDNSLSMSHVQYLQSRLMRLAQKAKRSNLEDCDVLNLPECSATELVDLEPFLDHMLTICPLFGLYAFESLKANKMC